MNFILENYLVFVLIGLFIVFALIGYIIDMVRKNNNEPKENNIPSQINNVLSENQANNLNGNNIAQVNNTPLNNEPKIESVNITKINENTADKLLENYNEINKQ